MAFRSDVVAGEMDVVRAAATGGESMQAVVAFGAALPGFPSVAADIFVEPSGVAYLDATPLGRPGSRPEGVFKRLFISIKKSLEKFLRKFMRVSP